MTTTGASAGKFETRFFHMVTTFSPNLISILQCSISFLNPVKVYGEEFGRVKGHFGPINALDVHPFGKSFASGSEDG